MAPRLQPRISIVRPALIGLTLCLAVAAGTAGWMIGTDAPSRLTLRGEVVARGAAQTLSTPGGGVVRLLRVTPGGRVAEGDLVVVFDDTAARAQLALLSERLVQAEIRRARLIAELDGADTFEVPPLSATIAEDTLTELRDRELALMRARAQTRRVQRDVFDAERRALRETHRLDPTSVDLDGGLAALARDHLQAESDLRARIERELADLNETLQDEVRPRFEAGTRALSNTQVTAPTDLLVTRLHATGPGSVITDGGPAFDYVPLAEGTALAADATEAELARLDEGTDLTVQLDGLDRPLIARLGDRLPSNQVELILSEDDAAVLQSQAFLPGQRLTASVEFASDAVVSALLEPLQGLNF